ncbi:MAG: NAD(P)/FAD-dependent oxidoreductase [Pseudomonadota bacterium]|nr:NAD(P)/FAD-dependent oxidoreductase [Pseudomonadota bacterium]
MDVDYAIVGGGPAGLAVAIEAALAGKSAVVVERCRGSVDKACGEGLMPPGVARLRALGVEIPEWGSHAFTGIRYVDGDVVAEADFAEGPGLGIRRLALSEAMFTRAAAVGVTLYQGTEAMGWTEDKAGVTLETTRGPVRARWLVAADGLHSRVRKDAGIDATPASTAGRRLGIRRHFTVTPWTDKVEVWWGDGVEAYVTPVGPERVGVAFLWSGGRWSGGRGNHEAFLQHFPALADKLGPAESTVRGAGPFGVRVAQRTRGRVLLVGDAAGYLDALTGEGLSLAFESAEALVRATIAGAPDRYEADWARITRRHLFLTGLLLQVAKRPWLRRRVVRALRRFPSGFAGFLAVNTGHWSPMRALPAFGAVGIGLLTG